MSIFGVRKMVRHRFMPASCVYIGFHLNSHVAINHYILESQIILIRTTKNFSCFDVICKMSISIFFKPCLIKLNWQIWNFRINFTLCFLCSHISVVLNYIFIQSHKRLRWENASFQLKLHWRLLSLFFWYSVTSALLAFRCKSLPGFKT